MRLLRWLFGGVWLRLIGWRLKHALVRRRTTERGEHANSQLYVFGDSLSDTGNVHQMLLWLRTASVTPSPPYYQGRFCDGPNWIDQLAEQMGLTSACAWEGGTNYAHGGAQTGFGLSTLVSVVPNLGEQIEFFAAARKSFASQAWVVLLGGHNNLFATVHGKDTIPWDVALGHLMAHLDRLYELGARQFVVPTLASIHRCPEAPVEKREAMQRWLAAFNQELAVRLEAFQHAHPDVRLVSPDLGRVTADLLDQPGPHGFADTTTACYDPATGNVVGDRSVSFWWDECHPTTLAHRAMAQSALDELARQPELSTCANPCDAAGV